MSVTLTGLTACGSNLPQPIPSTLSTPPTAVPSIVPASFDPAEISRWIDFRIAYGLRSDLGWVLLVAGNPENVNEINVPMTPAEIKKVSALNLTAEGLVPELQKYGDLFPSEFAGVVIESARVAIRFSGPIAAHRAAIIALYGSQAPIDVRVARYSLRDLENRVGEVEAARAWFPAADAELYRADVDELANEVRVRYIADDRTVEPLIRAHFGDPDWMNLKWYGPPEWTGPRGILRAIVVDRTGKPFEVECLPESLNGAVSSDYLPTSSGIDGVCEFANVPAVTWSLDISFENHAGQHVAVKRTVLVPGNGVGTVRLTVDP